MNEGVPEHILVDETRLLQILSNLTSNAIKFTEHGSVDIRLSHVKKYGKRHLLKCEIKDTGIGIPKEKFDKLFYSFSQIDDSSSKSFAGTGLGLAISKELCKLMKGDIGVYSDLGKGSTFWFTFEVTLADKEVSTIVQSLNEGQFAIRNHFLLKAPRILLVDDNAVNRQVASQILSKAGCQVEMVSSGPQAIESVREHDYDLIFMDIQMPDMDGVVATRKIRGLPKPVPPVVAMTAYSMREDKERFLAAGMDDYISKPIKAHTLISKVKDWVDSETFGADDLHLPDPEGGAPRVINQQVLDQLERFGGQELVHNVLQDFETEAQDQIEVCQQCLQDQDYPKILSKLHTLKGNAGTLGIEKVSNYAALIEQNLKNGNYLDLERDIRVLKDYFEEFRLHYREIKNGKL
ncbi:MAG: response regulator [Cytophagales bacterium]|nr:response regulator [Cytophagales bacterium]